MFTFKNGERPTGLAAVGAEDTFYIKVKKKICGFATNNGRRGDGNYIVRLSVKTSGNWHWAWVEIKERFPTKESAKEWLKANYKTLSNKYEFYFPWEE